jgi:hypothetical protein
MEQLWKKNKPTKKRTIKITLQKTELKKTYSNCIW